MVEESGLKIYLKPIKFILRAKINKRFLNLKFLPLFVAFLKPKNLTMKGSIVNKGENERCQALQMYIARQQKGAVKKRLGNERVNALYKFYVKFFIVYAPTFYRPPRSLHRYLLSSLDYLFGTGAD